MTTQRINGFELIKSFYSFVFDNQDKDIKPHHHSLYMFLVNQNNRNNWSEWFKCPYDLAMAGSGINSKKTYYSCLNDLVEFGLIQYQKGVNNFKAPVIKLEVQKFTSTVPQSEPVHTPLPTPQDIPQHIQLLIQLVEPLPIHNIKLLTNNLKPITNNISEILKWLEKKDKPTIKKDDVNEPANAVRRMTEMFTDFYKEKKGVDFIWQQKEFAQLKNIEKALLKKFKDSGKPLTPENFDLSFKHLLDLSILDKFVFEKLSPSIIYSQINSIITNGKETGTSKKSTEQINADLDAEIAKRFNK